MVRISVDSGPRILQTIPSPQKASTLGQQAYTLLHAFGVERAYRLDSEGLKLAALATVRNIMSQRLMWSETDQLITTLRRDETATNTFQRQNEAARQIGDMYQSALDQVVGSRKDNGLSGKQIFAAHAAADRFAKEYWRYTPLPHEQRGKMLRRSMRRGGTQFRPLSRMVSEMESHLPKGIQTFIAQRRTG